VSLSRDWICGFSAAKEFPIASWKITADVRTVLTARTALSAYLFIVMGAPPEKPEFGLGWVEN
jgi:hypothetical protein